MGEAQYLDRYAAAPTVEPTERRSL